MTGTHVRRAGRGTGWTWWVLVLLEALIGVVALFFFAMVGLAWAMALTPTPGDETSGLGWIFAPDGPWDQLGVWTVLDIVMLAAVALSLVAAFARRGGTRLGPRRIVGVLGATALTAVTFALTWWAVAFGVVKGGAGDVEALGMVRAVLVPTSVIGVLFTITVGSWRAVLRARPDATRESYGRSR